MCRVALIIPSEYILPGEDGLNSNLQMKQTDMFNQGLTLAHFWRDSQTEYSAFRFLRRDPNTGTEFPDEAVKLPLIANMNLVDGSYHWETIDQNPSVPTKSIACGGEYNVKYEDLEMQHERDTVRFKLVKDA